MNEEMSKKVEEIFSEVQAAEILTISVSTLRRMRKSGKVSFLKIGKNIRFFMRHLKAAIQEVPNEAF